MTIDTGWTLVKGASMTEPEINGARTWVLFLIAEQEPLDLP